MDKKLENLYVLARRAKDGEDHKTAKMYYDQILLENPNDWEAVFYSGYCTCASCVIGEIAFAAKRLGNVFLETAKLIDESNIEDKENALLSIANDVLELLVSLDNGAFHHFNEFWSVDNARAEYRTRLYECGVAAATLGDYFYDRGDKRDAALCYKKAEELWRGEYVPNEVATARIKEYDPNYKSAAEIRAAEDAENKRIAAENLRRDMPIIILSVGIIIAMIVLLVCLYSS